MNVTLRVFAVGFGLVLVSCGGGDDAADTTVTPVATEAPPTSTVVTETVAPTVSTAATAPADDNAITIADFAFSGVTEVAVGTTIVVTNTDSSPHTFSAEDGTFDSGALKKGDTFEFTFDTPGEFNYSCNFHPSMTGTITVAG